LGHGFALELVCEFVCGHLVLLASKITKQGVYKSRGYSARRKTELEVSGHRIIGNVLSGILPVYEQLAGKGWNKDELDDHTQKVARALVLDLRGISSAEQALHGMSDFISGMTDRYALRISRMLSGT
jgi:dGTPase